MGRGGSAGAELLKTKPLIPVMCSCTVLRLYTSFLTLADISE